MKVEVVTWLKFSYFYSYHRVGNPNVKVQHNGAAWREGDRQMVDTLKAAYFFFLCTVEFKMGISFTTDLDLTTRIHARFASGLYEHRDPESRQCSELL